MKANQSINSISLEDALELFKLPRILGEYEEQSVRANIGRYGPYVQLGKLFVSLPKEDDPMTVNLDRAIELIKVKQEEEKNKIIKLFPENEDVQLLNGRYGAYLKIGRSNFRLPKDKDPKELSLEECLEIAENQPKKKRGAKKK